MAIEFPTSSVLAMDLSAVWGQMVTGGGYATLKEAMSIIGVPVMTKKSFMETERIIGKKWWDSLELSMKEAAEEEKKLAIAQG